MMEEIAAMKKIRLTYNAPVTLTFVLLCFVATLLNYMLMYGREAQDMDSQPCHYSEVRGTQ